MPIGSILLLIKLEVSTANSQKFLLNLASLRRDLAEEIRVPLDLSDLPFC